MKYLATLDFGALEQTAAPNLANQDPTFIVNKVMPFVYSFAGIVILIMLVFGGYQYMTSQGDPKSIAAAQQRITWAIVGFIILFGSYWIVVFVLNALGVNNTVTLFR